MKISELRIPSTDGVHDLYAKLYEPDETPKALVQIVHGMVEHIERYDPVMRILCENGLQSAHTTISVTVRPYQTRPNSAISPKKTGGAYL